MFRCYPRYKKIAYMFSRKQTCNNYICFNIIPFLPSVAVPGLNVPLTLTRDCSWLPSLRSLYWFDCLTWCQVESGKYLRWQLCARISGSATMYLCISVSRPRLRLRRGKSRDAKRGGRPSDLTEPRSGLSQSLADSGSEDNSNTVDNILASVSVSGFGSRTTNNCRSEN